MKKTLESWIVGIIFTSTASNNGSCVRTPAQYAKRQPCLLNITDFKESFAKTTVVLRRPFFSLLPFLFLHRRVSCIWSLSALCSLCFPYKLDYTCMLGLHIVVHAISYSRRLQYSILFFIFLSFFIYIPPWISQVHGYKKQQQHIVLNWPTLWF